MYNRAQAKRREAQLAAAMTQITPKVELPISFKFRAIELEPTLIFAPELEPQSEHVEPAIELAPYIEEEKESTMSTAVATAPIVETVYTPEPAPVVVINPDIERAQRVLDAKIAECLEVVARAEEANLKIAEYETMKAWFAMAPPGAETIIKAILREELEVAYRKPSRVVVPQPIQTFVETVTPSSLPPLKRRILATFQNCNNKLNSSEVQMRLEATYGVTTKRTTILSSLAALLTEGLVRRSGTPVNGSFKYWLV